MPSKLRSRRLSSGLTLVELMVVVSIISILTIIGAVVYTGALQNRRDQSRIYDLNDIRQGLELYRHDKNSYPAGLNSLLTEYIKEIPSDPLIDNGWSDYVYIALPNSPVACGGSDCVSYKLCAKMEKLTGTISVCASPFNYEVGAD